MSANAQTIATPTQQVKASYAFDGGAVRHRIGLIALSTDQTIERDFLRMLPSDDVMFYTSRVFVTNPITVQNLRKMGPQLAEAAEKILPDVELGAIAYGCTSGTVAIGYDEVKKQIQAGKAGVSVVTPISAGVHAFHKLGVRQISLLTPYTDSVNQAMRVYLEDEGIRVINIGSFCLDSDLEMARIPPSAIYAAALQTCLPEADALFISCTAIRSAEVAESLESVLSKPVLTSNQCMFWESLRLSSCTSPVDGFGCILRNH